MEKYCIPLISVFKSYLEDGSTNSFGILYAPSQAYKHYAYIISRRYLLYYRLVTRHRNAKSHFIAHMPYVNTFGSNVFYVCFELCGVISCYCYANVMPMLCQCYTDVMFFSLKLHVKKIQLVRRCMFNHISPRIELIHQTGGANQV